MSYDSVNEPKAGIGRRIQEIRKKFNVEPSEFGKMLNPEVTAPTIQSWERGNVPSSRIEELSKLGKTSVEYLITGRDYQVKKDTHNDNITGRIFIKTETGCTFVTERLSRSDLIKNIQKGLSNSKISFNDKFGIPFVLTGQYIVEISGGDYEKIEQLDKSVTSKGDNLDSFEWPDWEDDEWAEDNDSEDDDKNQSEEEDQFNSDDKNEDSLW